MTAQIITVCSRKGGTAKTTTTAALSAIWRRNGKKTLLIDLDSQANLTYQTGAAPGLSSLEVLTGTATAAEAIQHTEQGDIIPASSGLAAADLLLTEIGKEYRLKESLEPIRDMYDMIVIDTSAQLGVCTTNALTASDGYLIPITADAFSLTGIGVLMETVQGVQRYCNRDLKCCGAFLTRYRKSLNLSKAMQQNAEELVREYGITLLKTTVRECTAAREAAAMQTDLLTYAPKSTAVVDYIALAEELKIYKWGA